MQLPIERWPKFRRKLPYGRIKTGYKVNPDDLFELLPDPEKIIFIEQGFDYLDAGSSLREVCEWLGQKLSMSMVHQTVNNLYKTHRKPYNVGKRTLKKVGRKHTKEEKAILSAKRSAKAANIRAQKAQEEFDRSKGKLKPEDYEVPPVPKEPRSYSFVPKQNVGALPEVFKEKELIFKPNPGPQSLFLGASEEEVLYGGAAGGGKSYAMLADPMRYFHNPNFVGLLIRRTNDELRELKWESQKIYPKAFPGAKWKEKDSMWVFPSGAKFWMTYLERDDDVMRYQGQAFTWIGVDELTQYATPFAWTYLKSRLRTSDPELKKSLCMRATTNPGGPGHHWVKKMFIDPAPAGKAFWATDVESGETMKYPDDHHDPDKAGKPLFKRRFIPALLKDNPYLYDDGAYERSLQGLPEEQRRKLLDGDWSVMEGAAFAEFNPKYHVCEPFDIPHTWRRFRGADYGYSSPSAVLWFAIDPAYEILYVYRELYKKGLTAHSLAEKVLNAEQDESISYGVLDSSVWHQRGHNGPSIAEEMIQYGCRWRPADRGQGSRVSGKNRLHELLKIKEIDGEMKPSLIIFNTCRQLISDLPSLPSDPDGTDDIDDRAPNDHTYDALRYGIMSRPRSGSALDWGGPTRKLDTYTPFDKTFGY
jgi:hypothetical protein